MSFPHHAIFIEHDTPTSEIIWTFLSPHTIQSGHPDVYILETDVFKIDDARTLGGLALSRAVELPQRVFGLSFRLITNDAQNALLKTLEDTETAVFVIVGPSFGSLLPTVQSRLMKVSGSREGTLDTREAERFLGAPLPERLALLGDIAESRESTALFLRSLTSLVSSTPLSDLERKGALSSLLDAERFLKSPSASRKMILESLSITLPRIEK